MRYFLLCLVTLCLCYLLSINLRLYHASDIVVEENGFYDQDLYHSLQFLKHALRDGAGNDMQDIYPEGYVFIHALYGLSWANTIQTLAPEHTIRREGVAEIRWTIGRLESDTALAIFEPQLRPAYGVFYQGWLNFLRSQYLQVLPQPTDDAQQLEHYEVACAAIAEAIESHYTPFLYSYSGGCWPADNVVALASLAEHDRFLDQQYTTLRAQWLVAMQSRVDERGLIPHRVDLGQGNSAQDALGSSQSLMLAFWPLIDSTFAQQQYDLYQQHFVDERWGLPGIREYPHGTDGVGHIDAGPVLLGIGGSASIVGMGTVGQYGDASLHAGLRNSIEGFGVPLRWRGQKRYLFGQIPMADAFISWSRSRVPLKLRTQSHFSKWGFHWRSGLVLVVAFGILYLFWRRKATSKTASY